MRIIKRALQRATPVTRGTKRYTLGRVSQVRGALAVSSEQLINIDKIFWGGKGAGTV